MITKKKSWPEIFQKVVEGRKNVELRLADFECKPGDTIILEEWIQQQSNTRAEQ